MENFKPIKPSNMIIPYETFERLVEPSTELLKEIISQLSVDAENTSLIAGALSIIVNRVPIDDSTIFMFYVLDKTHINTFAVSHSIRNVVSKLSEYGASVYGCEYIKDRKLYKTLIFFGDFSSCCPNEIKHIIMSHIKNFIKRELASYPNAVDALSLKAKLSMVGSTIYDTLERKKSAITDRQRELLDRYSFE